MESYESSRRNLRRDGNRSEQTAWRYLRGCGYRFVAANFNTLWGELDLVVEKDGVMVFVEVKSRWSERFGRPEEAVTSGKKAHLAKAAMSFLQEINRFDQPTRFDVVCIDRGRIRHFKNAFEVSAGFTF